MNKLNTIQRFREKFTVKTNAMDGTPSSIVASNRDGQVVYLNGEELEQFILQEQNRLLDEVLKKLPKQLGYEDYGYHIHVYVNENRGKCGICGLSWKKATEYQFYNRAINDTKNMLKSSIEELKEGVR